MVDPQSPPSPSTPKVSAIVLSYNNAAGLERCLRALEASTSRPEMEIIVMENGSTDGSENLDAAFPNVTFLKLKRNFGATKALNIGMRTAQGDYFFYLSPEMEPQSDAIAQLAAFLDQESAAAAVVPMVVDAHGNPAGDLWKLPDAEALKRAWRDSSLFPKADPPAADGPTVIGYAGRSALMARKFFVRGLNYFDENYGDFGADLDLAYQIRRAGKKTVLLPTAKVIRTPGPDLPASARTAILADRANGISRFLSKHHGGAAGIGFQVAATLGSLVRAQLGLMSAVAGGSKIDGSQSGL